MTALILSLHPPQQAVYSLCTTSAQPYTAYLYVPQFVTLPVHKCTGFDKIFLEHLEHLEHLEYLGYLGYLEHLDHLDYLGHLEPLEPLYLLCLHHT